MKKALILAVLATALCASCQSKEASEWKSDAVEIEINHGYEYGAKTFKKEDNDNYKLDVFYKTVSESSIYVKTLWKSKKYFSGSTNDYEKKTYIALFSNCTYTITLADGK